MAAINPEVKNAIKVPVDTYTPFVHTYNSKLPLSQQAAMASDFMVDYLKGEDIALVGFSTEARLKLKAALKLFKEKAPDEYNKFKKDTFVIVAGDQKLYEAVLKDGKFSEAGGWYLFKYRGEHKWFMIKEECARRSSLASLAFSFAHENMHQIQNRDKKPISEFEAYLKGLLVSYRIGSSWADWNVEEMAADFEEQVWRAEASNAVEILSGKLAEIFSRQGISVENTFLDSLIAKQAADNISYRKMEFGGKFKDYCKDSYIEFLREDGKLTFRAAIKFILANNGFYSYSDYGKLHSILGIKKGISTLERKITGSDNYREKARLLLELGKLREILANRELDLAVTNELRGTFVPMPKPINKSAGSPLENAQSASSAMEKDKPDAELKTPTGQIKGKAKGAYLRMPGFIIERFDSIEKILSIIKPLYTKLMKERNLLLAGRGRYFMQIRLWMK